MERAFAGAVSHVYYAAGGQVNTLMQANSVSCGSWLACDEGLTVGGFGAWHTAIAGKPAPTENHKRGGRYG